MKKILVICVLCGVILSLMGCGSELMREAFVEEFGWITDEVVESAWEENKQAMSEAGGELGELESMLLEEMLKDKEPEMLQPDPVATYDSRGYITRLADIPESEIVREESLTMSEFHPFQGLTEAMMGNVDDPTESGIDAVGNGLAFVSTWLSSSTEITYLYVTQGADGRLNIDYGEAIEMNYSGKKLSLHSVLVNYYGGSPSVILNGGSMADECIREWFGVDGEGKYSMLLNFGRVYVGDFGYRLILEDGVLYQVPMLHEDTSFQVYYKEKDGDAVCLFDAADILRNTKIRMPDEEAEKILNRLREAGYLS